MTDELAHLVDADTDIEHVGDGGVPALVEADRADAFVLGDHALVVLALAGGLLGPAGSVVDGVGVVGRAGVFAEH